ncbi:hypothetical protein PSTT_01063 [Puccinia striiformis]|uniref:Uncharacterized protein n=1 Tax=Puccinia striiformis TaxID=27350 RepID=A0A2S4W4Y8_9BASI|nr:hypothetical protein PSTT_01063 [Puccinia striiformis]
MEPNSTPGDLNAAEEHSGPRAGGPEDQINDNQETIQPQAVPSRGNLSFNSTARTTREQYAYLWRFLDPDDLDADEEGLAEMFGIALISLRPIVLIITKSKVRIGSTKILITPSTLPKTSTTSSMASRIPPSALSRRKILLTNNHNALFAWKHTLKVISLLCYHAMKHIGFTAPAPQ